MSTLYRKHRPSLFSEVSGQNHIVQTLSNTIKNNRVGQAYLFTGSRGIGKTTLARIFSKAINCLNPNNGKKEIAIEPCNKCKNCKAIIENKTIDINEIDAASHTGVDNIRQLKERIDIAPSLLKYKVYIIDEVHMLSIGAFNALLKTLEEPPKHVVFILATTELHKVPETIISRCQRFNFTRLSQQQITERLKQIAKKEKVKIDNLALEIIATEAEGGMRDAESILNQIISLEDKNITGEEVSQILGTYSQDHIIKFIKNTLSGDAQKSLKQIEEIQNEGINLINFNKTVLSILRNIVIQKINPKIIENPFSPENKKRLEKIIESNNYQDLIKLINLFQKSLSDSKESAIPQMPLELAVIEFYLDKKPKVKNLNSESVVSQTPKITKTAAFPITKKEKETIENKIKNKEKVDSSPKFNPIDINLILRNWSKILETTKNQSHSIHACLKSCVPIGTKNNIFYIKTNYSFHKNRLNENSNKLTIAEIIGKITQYKIRIEIVTEDQISSLDLNKNSKTEDVLTDALQMMGGRITE